MKKAIAVYHLLKMVNELLVRKVFYLMMIDKQYYFHTLPLHPQPERLESLTSYLTKIAEANGIDSIIKLAHLCFPKLDVKSVRLLKDFPPISFRDLGLITVCTEEALKSTTFYHIAAKFGRPATHQSLSNFLLKSISKSLRYCPLCLTESAYYSLTWRFVDLEGCVNHNCRLQDRCPHCDSFISLLKEPLKIGHCPECQGDLRRCTPVTLTFSEKQLVQSFMQDVKFLLSPYIFGKNINSINKLLGKRFALLRQEKGLTIVNIATHLNMSSKRIESLELGETTSLQVYLRYASFLHVSLQNIFEELEQYDIQDKKFRSLRGKLEINEDDIIKEIEEAVENLIVLNREVTLEEISRCISISLERLHRYPRVDQFVKHLVYEKSLCEKMKLEDEIYKIVKNTIINLEERKELITYMSVSEITGINRDNFKLYPRVNALFEMYINYPSYKKALNSNREDDLIIKTKDAIIWLKEHKQPVTGQAVAKIIGISSANLKKYPRVKLLLEESISDTGYSIIMKKYQVDEREIYDAVQRAIKNLKDNGQKITFSSVARVVGMNPKNFRKYPKVSSLLEKHVINVHPQSTILYQLNEEKLYCLARDTISIFIATGQPVTFTRVCNALELAPARLKFYPKVRTFIEENIDYSYLKKDLQKKEEDLLVFATECIIQLKNTGATISQKSVCKMLNIPLSNLKLYPRLKETLEQVANLSFSQSYYNRRVSYDEEALLANAGTVIENLEKCGQKITKAVFCRKLGISQSALKGLIKLDKLVKISVEKQRWAKEGEVLERVERAVCELEKCGREVTNQAISEIAHISISRLYHYALVSSFIKNTVKDKRLQQRNERENELANKVIEEICQLRQLELPISITNIAKGIKVTTDTLKKYPRVMSLIENFG